MNSQKAVAEFERASAAFQEGRYSEALTLLWDMDVRFPNNPDILYALAQSRLRMHQKEEATEIALRLRHEFSDPRGNDIIAAIAEVSGKGTTAENTNSLRRSAPSTKKGLFARLTQGKNALAEVLHKYDYRTIVFLACLLAITLIINFYMTRYVPIADREKTKELIRQRPGKSVFLVWSYGTVDGAWITDYHITCTPLGSDNVPNHVRGLPRTDAKLFHRDDGSPALGFKMKIPNDFSAETIRYRISGEVGIAESTGKVTKANSWRTEKSGNTTTLYINSGPNDWHNNKTHRVVVDRTFSYRVNLHGFPWFGFAYMWGFRALIVVIISKLVFALDEDWRTKLCASFRLIWSR